MGWSKKWKKNKISNFLFSDHFDQNRGRFENKYDVNGLFWTFCFLNLDTFKLLRSYLRPTGVDRRTVWDILKKSPIDPQPIPWHFYQNRAVLEKKVNITGLGLDFLFLDLDTCKMLRSYLRPIGVDRNIVWDILKKSPINPQPIPWHFDQNRGRFFAGFSR